MAALTKRRRKRFPSPLYSGDRVGVRGQPLQSLTPHPRPLSPEYRGEGSGLAVALHYLPCCMVESCRRRENDVSPPLLRLNFTKDLFHDFMDLLNLTRDQVKAAAWFQAA